MSEGQKLERLDHAVRTVRAQRVLTSMADEVERMLLADDRLRLAWKTVPLHLYDSLPEDIASSWVFALRANSTSGAERHPNSIQRVMSFRGSADLQTWHGSGWRSNVLVDDPSRPIERRWLSIPRNVWHRPVMGEMNWVVVSFHTASEDTLIEELAAHSENPDAGPRAVDVYSGRSAR